MSGFWEILNNLIGKRIEEVIIVLYLKKDHLSLDTIGEMLVEEGSFEILESWISLWSLVQKHERNLSLISEMIPNLMDLNLQRSVLKLLKDFTDSLGPSTQMVKLMNEIVLSTNLSSRDLSLFRLHLPSIIHAPHSSGLSLQHKLNFQEKKPHWDFRNLSFTELLFDTHPYEGTNIFSGVYESLDHYLNTHFYLLKEDYTSQLRSEESFRSLCQGKVIKGLTNVDFRVQLFNKNILKDVKIGTLWRFGNSSTYARVINIEVDSCVVRFFKENIHINEESLCEIFEFKIFFEPYFQVLRALRQINTLGRFEKYIISTTKALKFRSSINVSKEWNFSPLYPNENKFNNHKKNDTFFSLEHADKQLEKDSKIILLTPSQKVALLKALSNELTLIHGPPGTGKSYVGKIIIKMFLSNISLISSKKTLPILLISHTNQALDNFLEEMLSFTSKIIRVGHRSTSDKLEKLHDVRRRYKRQELFPKLLSDYSGNPYQDLDTVSLQNSFLCSKYDIVGITSTSLASNYEMIQLLGPEIVIVEEASEMLESHVLPAIGEFTRYLILIGDHRQLRPKTATHDVSKRNGLEVSLFERLFLNEFDGCVQLNEQLRFSSEVSKLVRGLLYPNLKDHFPIKSTSNVAGCNKSIQILKHENEEGEGNLNNSKSNVFEAEMSVSLADFLVKCGNPAEKIVILSAYKGQLNKILQMKSKFDSLCDVEVETVDKYQGREKYIVILSLVRSAGNSIGFLSVNNRIIVALSRAKVGLFIIGNFLHLSKKTELWKKILQYFEEEQIISSNFKLHCPNHSDKTEISVFNPIDFKQITCSYQCISKWPKCNHLCREPCEFNHFSHINKSCSEVCGSLLKCGHTCKLLCHPDSAHMVCKEPCSKLFSRCGHVCRKKCFEKCEKVCTEVIDKSLGCGHTLNGTICGRDEVCKAKCSSILKCGHSKCRNLCYICKRNGVCNPKQCNKNQVVSLACGHSLSMKCSDASDDRIICKQSCLKKLSCGHQCPLFCSDQCSDLACTVILNQRVDICGHETLIKCGSMEKIPCSEPCQGLNKLCGHPCSGVKCSDCLNGQCHLPCRELCSKTLICGHKCSELCGAPCPPCKLKCSNICPHQKRCTRKCDEECSFSCKSKCEGSCEHQKCSLKCSSFECRKCKEYVTVKHGELFFKTVCGFEIEDVVKNCPVGETSKVSEISLVLPDCKHLISLSHFDKILASEIIGALTCPVCISPIKTWIHGYKSDINKKNKDEILSVHDVFFNLKVNLVKWKSKLKNSIQASTLSNEIKSQVMKTLPNMNLSLVISMDVRLRLLRHIEDFVRSSEIDLYIKLKRSLEMVDVIGKGYISQFLNTLKSRNFPRFELKEFYSFEKGDWRIVNGSPKYFLNLY